MKIFKIEYWIIEHLPLCRSGRWTHILHGGRGLASGNDPTPNFARVAVVTGFIVLARAAVLVGVLVLT